MQVLPIGVDGRDVRAERQSHVITLAQHERAASAWPIVVAVLMQTLQRFFGLAVVRHLGDDVIRIFAPVDSAPNAQTIRYGNVLI